MLASLGSPYSGPTAANQSCNVYTSPNNCPGYVEGYVVAAPFGTPASQLTPSFYYYPDSPTDRAQYGATAGRSAGRDLQRSGHRQGAVHARNRRSRVRPFDGLHVLLRLEPNWTVLDARRRTSYGYPGEALAQNYLLITHTSGGEFQFSDQINDKNLLQFTVNQTYANVLRDNNTTASSAYEPRQQVRIGIVSGNSQGNFTCWTEAWANGNNRRPDIRTGLAGAVLRGQPGQRDDDRKRRHAACAWSQCS